MEKRPVFFLCIDIIVTNYQVPKMKMRKFTYIDLFAGCGGLSEGFTQSGLFDGLAHVEWELPMVNTLRHRLIQKWEHTPESAEKSVIHFDIQKTEELIFGQWNGESEKIFGATNHPFVKKYGLRGLIGERDVDIVIGGPPCQAYSIAGRAQDKNSMKNDYRNYLFESFIKVVDEFKPKLFVFENVPGILSAKPGDKLVIERIFEAFGAIGYEINVPEKLKDTLYTASDFGIAQKRDRLIIIGVCKDSGLELKEIYANIDELKTNKLVNVGDIIGELPKLYPLEKPKKEKGKNISHVMRQGQYVHLHNPRYHNLRDINIFKKWILDDMNRKSTHEKLEFYNTVLGKKTKYGKYRNLEWDRPSPTIVAHLQKDGLLFIHPDVDQARTITVREAALLQSFPLDYDFLGSQGYCYKMIGNAVPPLMAEKIAKGIYKVLVS
ncbi:DNA cytosine methyltransferase [Acinetobacter sp. YH12136]|uniref:DNA cytosine methyltransferase n=1 Tax=Acinetobacter sp. YH12136 TaxID=2601120 RepID=UPI00359FF8B7